MSLHEISMSLHAVLPHFIQTQVCSYPPWQKKTDNTVSIHDTNQNHKTTFWQRKSMGNLECPPAGPTHGNPLSE